MLAAFGAVESVFFRGVGPGGYDIYGAQFAKGFAEFRVRLAADGTIEDIAFRPDGDGASGEVRTCAQEQTLSAGAGNRAHPATPCLQQGGADIRVFALDGGRQADLPRHHDW